MNYRKERIERLLTELRYEITRGVMEGEIDPYTDYRFDFPHKSKFVFGRFYTEEVEAHHLGSITPTPIVKLVD